MATFTADQIAKIRDLRDAGPKNGNYSHIYEYIAGILPQGSQEQRWFEGAAQANADQGVFSAFIRKYSAAQMALRGVPYSDTLVQKASNQVALNAFADILGANRRPQADGTVLAPTIDEIASLDATGVGEVLFSSIPNDSAYKANQNAGWSGALLFTGLGDDQTWRLFGSNQGAAQFDSLDDVRNFLFARNAFSVALKAAVAEFFAEVPGSVVDLLKLVPVFPRADFVILNG